MEKKKNIKQTTSNIDTKETLDNIMVLLKDIKELLSNKIAQEKSLKSEDLFHGGH